ncbi:MAG: hypothetical protein OQJ97_18620 [Rhodospirillales bacterium]|nr:hypothetical protein [Rhodospirillales bacterium]
MSLKKYKQGGLFRWTDPEGKVYEGMLRAVSQLEKYPRAIVQEDNSLYLIEENGKGGYHIITGPHPVDIPYIVAERLICGEVVHGSEGATAIAMAMALIVNQGAEA